MEVAVTTLSQKDAGKIELAASVFEQPVRKDILHQVVLWQLAKRRQGTHSTKTRGQVKATGAKKYKQKPNFRSGFVIHFAAHLRKPEVQSRHKAKHRSALHGVVKVRYNEVCIMVVNIRCQGCQIDSCRSGNHEDKDKTEAV